MSGSNGEQGRYLVELTGPAEAEYLDIVERATEAGVEKLITDAFAAIRARLRLDPREFGEPMYHLRGMRMTVRKASVRPLYIEYGVHDQQSVVVIRRVRWLDDPAATA